MRGIVCLFFVFSMLAVTGCKTTYYKTMEAFGKHKRDLLVDRVEDARDAQQDAKEQFQTALEKFSSVINFSGGELKKKYTQLNAEFEQSESKAKAVHDRISDVESVSSALFEEWEDELDQYTNKDLRRSSELKLKETRQRYKQLIAAMKKA